MSTHAEPDEVAPGVHRLGLAYVNCYLVVDEDGMTLVDAGLPGTARVLDLALAHLGAVRGDIDAVLLTHGHFDHVGMARRLWREHRLAPLVHPRDERLVRHPYRYAHERARLPYPIRHPRTLGIVASMARQGALRVRGVEAVAEVHHGHVVDVPGRPRAIWTPGHTEGHCAFHFERHGVLMTGDALVTLDPYTGSRGPRIVAGAATADSTRALTSLDALLSCDARLLLPGHGDPWSEGVPAAVAAAARAGRS